MGKSKNAELRKLFNALEFVTHKFKREGSIEIDRNGRIKDLQKSVDLTGIQVERIENALEKQFRAKHPGMNGCFAFCITEKALVAIMFMKIKTD